MIAVADASPLYYFVARMMFDLERSRPAKDCSMESRTPFKILADILCKKPQNEIAVLLQ